MGRTVVVGWWLTLALGLAPPAEPADGPAEETLDLAMPAAEEPYPRLRISGFSDITYSEPSGPDSPGFALGQFVLHLASSLSPRVDVFGELSVNARTDAGTGSPAATGFNAEVERIIGRFSAADWAKFSVGRYHTPINWWNTAFHHGLWLQTTISRPDMTQFGGRFIPVHFVGALAEGSVAAGGANLNYQVGVGNGRGGVLSRAGDAGDINGSRAWLAGLFVRPSRPFGLQAGGAIYRDRLSLGEGRTLREWIYSAHVVWAREDPELIFEYARVEHDEPSRSFDSEAWYGQVAWRLPAMARRFKPYARHERLRTAGGDPVFTTVPGRRTTTAGVRYDAFDFAAIKIEYRRIRRDGAASSHGWFGQVSLAF